MTSYNKVRRLSFAIYILISVLFACFIIKLGMNDIERIANFADKERSYSESLIKSSNILDATIKIFPLSIEALSNDRITLFSEKLTDLKKSLNKIPLDSRGKNYSEITEKLKEKCRLIDSALNSIHKNYPETNLFYFDRKIILQNDLKTIYLSLIDTGEILHNLFFTEYEKSEYWQRQSFFFFKRLQYMLVTFFILTIFFIVLSSSYSGLLLKKYLRKLSEGTKQISSGNLRYRFSGIETDEMGELMADFNSMASRLERQTHQLKKINEELEKKAEELLEANQHKDRFFANMSHELRTPLNSIIGFADLNIARTDYSGEKLIDNSKKILIAAEHLLSLISGLLDIAKSDAGVLKPIMEKNNISNTLNMVVDMLKPIVDRKKLYLELQSSSNIEFYYDEKLIKQVLINLINNAIKFTHEGGIKIRLIETSENVEIEIEDSGIGISEEDQKKIFKDFHRVESGLTSNYEGAGLGLALSRRFVRMHGGEISLESQIGKGSIFKISLPKKQNIA